MQPPTFEDIVAARQFISPYLPKTPVVRISKISEALGCDYHAKLENLQPVGAFKVRGGVNLVPQAGQNVAPPGASAPHRPQNIGPLPRKAARSATQAPGLPPHNGVRPSWLGSTDVLDLLVLLGR